MKMAAPFSNGMKTPDAVFRRLVAMMKTPGVIFKKLIASMKTADAMSRRRKGRVQAAEVP
jgi:hypothetical protein